LELEEIYDNVIYKNYLRNEIFSDSLFRDGDHLNICGATLLSSQLNDVIINYQNIEK